MIEKLEENNPQLKTTSGKSDFTTEFLKKRSKKRLARMLIDDEVNENIKESERVPNSARYRAILGIANDQ